MTGEKMGSGPKKAPQKIKNTHGCVVVVHQSDVQRHAPRFDGPRVLVLQHHGDFHALVFAAFVFVPLVRQRAGDDQP